MIQPSPSDQDKQRKSRKVAKTQPAAGEEVIKPNNPKLKPIRVTDAGVLDNRFDQVVSCAEVGANNQAASGWTWQSLNSAGIRKPFDGMSSSDPTRFV
jgi:hypothetical protein